MNLIQLSIVEEYTKDALEILGASLKLAQTELCAFYRVVALQLRILLCDTTRRHGHMENTALLPAVQPGIMFHILDEDGFNINSGLLPLDEWLAQPIPGTSNGMTIRKLIRRVCDQDGGSHVDIRPPAGLAYPPQAIDWILLIGEYVYNHLAICGLTTSLPPANNDKLTKYSP